MLKQGTGDGGLHPFWELVTSKLTIFMIVFKWAETVKF